MMRFPFSGLSLGAGILGLGLVVLGGILSEGQGQARKMTYREAVETELVDRVREFYWSGEYAECVDLCEAAVEGEVPGFLYRDLLIRSHEASGELERARAFIESRKADGEGESLPLLMAEVRILRALGEMDDVLTLLDRVNALAMERERKSLTGDDLVALGTAAELLGADPQKILQHYFEEAQEDEDMRYGSPYLAAGELALAKRDFAQAAKQFRAGIKRYPGDPDLLTGLAAAFYASDREKFGETIAKALEINPRHVGAMVWQAKHLIDAEQFRPALDVLKAARKVDDGNVEAWTHEAAVEYLHEDLKAGDAARERALSRWEGNPMVDHEIGKSLSRMRRFKEGETRQLLALEMNPDFLPAKIQLAQDLLRLGREEEAWVLVDEVHEADPYNVVAFNLATLRDELATYATLENDDFIIRMTEEEAAIYGDRALELLSEAKEVLCEKYGLEMEEKTLVEFFPEQQDFAVRTLGVPGGSGLLGVCFGSVITMNSPGSITTGRNNWEATLWHEFAHVVTLGLTKNKMPRWLSEGISVYEELERDDAWGQKMTPRYRMMILEEDRLRPLSEIGDMFLNPQDGEELMFAYFESAMAVAYLVEEYGMEKMRRLLRDLGEGVFLEKAFAKHMGPVAKLDREFEKYAKAQAAALAPGVDWSKLPEGFDVLDAGAVAAFVAKEPTHFGGLKWHVQHLTEAEDWEGVVVAAGRLRDLYPGDTGGDSAYFYLAKAYREMGAADEERAVLEAVSALSAEATPAYLRLMEKGLMAEDWDLAETNARRQLAVNPFLNRTHFCLACAHEAKGETEGAIAAFEKALKLGPASPGEVNYRLAKLHRAEDLDLAKRYVLDGLAEAPRHREALAFLMELKEAERETSELMAAPELMPPGPDKSDGGKEEKAAN
ncbi:MAG: tetratricopeptide repeat protein [Verrucomicrobiota bacterium]